ncbi:hypothetical protein Hanom_Chr07g00644101 [Helianthus anomalus]
MCFRYIDISNADFNSGLHVYKDSYILPTFSLNPDKASSNFQHLHYKVHKN